VHRERGEGMCPSVSERGVRPPSGCTASAGVALPLNGFMAVSSIWPVIDAIVSVSPPA